MAEQQTDGRTGHCLCGAVKVKLTAKHKDVGVCHCGMCRRWSGSPMMAIRVGQDIDIEGEENIAAYRSSEWAERCFCKTCGTHLFFRIVETGDLFLPAGLLDDAAGLDMHMQIFIDEKPAFYDFANETVKLTGEEVFALYAPQSDGEDHG